VRLDAWSVQTVRAQPADASSADTSQEHKRVLQEAMAEFDRGNWSEARALFEAAHEMQPTARTLRAIGMCAFEEKSYAMAISFLSQALQDSRKALTSEQRKQTEDALWRAREFVAKYQLALSPSETTVRVDGHEPLVLEGKLLLDPGSHRLSFSAPGYQSSEQTLTVRARETAELAIKLVAVGSSDAIVSAAEPSPSAGASQRARLTNGQWAGIGLVGLGAAGLGLGIGFGVDAKKKHDRSGCESTCDSRADKALNDKARTSGNVSTAMFAVGGAAAAAGIFLAVWARERKTSAHALQFSPMLAQGLVGGSARGVW
jgi:hypothetical protein